MTALAAVGLWLLVAAVGAVIAGRTLRRAGCAVEARPRSSLRPARARRRAPLSPGVVCVLGNAARW